MEIKDKFDNIDLEKLAELENYIHDEIVVIQEETDDFNDDDMVDIFSKPFSAFYRRIEKEFPEALRSYVPPEPPPVIEPPAPVVTEMSEAAKKAMELANKYGKKRK